MVDSSCLIIAGEKSGEEHAMSFLPTLMESSPKMKFFGVGGDEMSSLGVENLYHLKDFSSWGFSEVIGKIPFYFKALNQIVEEVKKRKCKFAILIDFQDFNLRLAKRLNREGVRVFYYVAPQAWAWKAWRAKALEENVDTLFTIIPFEKKWFEQRGVNRVKSVPHPLWFHYKDRVHHEILGTKVKSFQALQERKKRLLLLPGSRNFEVAKVLPIFYEYLNKSREEFEVGLVQSPNVHIENYRPFLDKVTRIYQHDDISEALTWCDFSLAASGTVTLTCALFEVPTVVCYGSSLLNEFIFYTFLSYDGPISLANIVHNERVFPELVQNELSAYNIEKELEKWFTSEKSYTVIKEKLAKTLEIIGGDSENVGTIIHQLMNQEGSKEKA
tara:strand:+ start:271 stop:1428 length:1158 start_codon:yes stop_codon:yes gene_type:complete